MRKAPIFISEQKLSPFKLLLVIKNDRHFAVLKNINELGVESPPAMMIELRRPEMVAACQEHLMRIAEQDGFSGISRDRIRIQINSLIRELER